jgi:hypothetical protein
LPFLLLTLLGSLVVLLEHFIAGIARIPNETVWF